MKLFLTSLVLLSSLALTTSCKTIYGTDSEVGPDILAEDSPTQFVSLNSLGPNEKALYLKRGDYLVNSVAACGFCHSSANDGRKNSPLSGGKLMRDSKSELYSSNITSDIETGIGAWSFHELSQAIRAGIGKDGRALSLDLHSGYRWLSDYDTISIIAYLKSTSPVKNYVPKRELSWKAKRNWLLLPKYQELKGYVTSLEKAPTVSYGRYLFKNVSRCSSCHSLDEKTANDPYPNWTSSYINKGDPNIALSRSFLDQGYFPVAGPILNDLDNPRTSKEDLIQYLSNGSVFKTKNSNTFKKIDPRFCPWPYYNSMDDTDKLAIGEFLFRKKGSESDSDK